MPSTKQLQRQFQGIQDVRQPVRQKFHALLGHPDGTTIEDPETAGYVFVRIDGDNNRVRRALCREVLQRYNQPVIVAYSDELPNTLEVIKLDRDAFAPSSGGGSSWDGGAQLGAHAGQHALGGGDTVWIQTKQIVPMRTRPAIPASMRVFVESGAYQYQSGFNYWPGGYSSDMTAQIPAAGLQLYRVIYIDAATNTLAYANTATMVIDPYLADFETVLDLIPTSCVPLAAIRLYNGQTTIVEADIYELRSLISSAPGTTTATAHDIVGAVHTVTGSQYQLVGLTATNTLGLLTPASTVGANQIPIGGTGGAIVWSGAQTFNAGAITASGFFFDAKTDGSSGGFRAGASSDVLWHRHASTANVWVTPDSVEIDGTLGIGTAPSNIVGLRGDFVVASAVAPVYATLYTVTVTGTTATAYGAYYGVITDDLAFTLGEAITIYAASPDKGAASTITTAYGLKVGDITAGGTNYAIYTGAGAVRFGGAVTTTTLGLTATSNQIVFQSAGVTGTLTWTPATSNKVITFPNATGTVALLSVANVFTAVQNVDMASAPYWYISVSAVPKSYWGVATAANQFVTGSAANDMVLRAETANILLTADGGTTIAATIDSNSNFGIGIAPSYRLDVYTTAAAYAAKIKNFNGTDAGGGLWIDTRWNTAANRPLRITSNNELTELLAVGGDGKIYAGGTAGLVSQVVVLAKITAGGANGSFTVTQGIVTAYTAPT